MGTKSQNSKFHNPYTNLAYAIILSGERCHDTTFLDSDWCDMLRMMCSLDDEMYGRRNIELRGRSHVSTANIPLEVNN